MLELLQNLWQFALANAEISLAIVGAATGGVGWFGKKSWKRLQRKKRQVAIADNFPFEVIRPQSTDVVQRIYGSQQQGPNDPLADFNIPYQQRLSQTDVQQVLMDRLLIRRWLLVLGRTGLGKTREAAELAQRHSQEGWTVMRLENHQLLTVPDSLPVDRLDRQPKLLFVLDNLNQAMVLGQQLPTVDDEGKKAEPLKSPLQTRLLETLQFYITACGEDRVRIVATARNEQEHTADAPSEWEKLEIEKYSEFWQRFDQYELTPPENQAVEEMLAATAAVAGISIEGDLADIAGTNDRTFRNPVENLERLKAQGAALSQETFQQTLKGNWALRYQTVKERYGEVAVALYDGVDLLRQARVALTRERVLLAAQVSTGHTDWWQWWRKHKLSNVLAGLVKTERLLEPRDGQIEAKGYSADLEHYFEALCKNLSNTLNSESSVNSLLGLALTAYEKQVYPIALDLVEQSLKHKLAINLQPIVLEFKGNIFSRLNRQEEAISAYSKALEIKFDSHQALYNKGVALGKLGRDKEAISAYSKALEIKPDSHQALYNKGVALGKLGRDKEAISAYNKAIDIKPDKYKALENKGLALLRLERHEDAITAFNQAIEINPKGNSPWYNKACAYAQSHQIENSLTCLQQAIELSHTHENIELAKTDADFDSIRNDPRFQAIITQPFK